MHRSSLILVLTAALGLGACGAVDTVTRLTPLAVTPLEPATPMFDPSGWTVSEVVIDVPRSLRVSEANVFYPNADIVWRGDPFGDRYEQIARMLDDAVTTGVSGLRGPRKVVMNVEVLRFHGVTEKTRYTVGGVHSVRFLITVRDAESGQVLQEPQFVNADLKAYGGAQAFEAERRGETQKVRITSHVAGLMQRKYSTPVTVLASAR